MVISTRAASISDATCVCWPAVSATDVLERLPSEAKPPTSPAAPHAAPWARSSASASTSAPCFSAIAREAASVSEYPTKTTDSAPITSAKSSPRSMSGTATENTPVGTSPVTATPCSSRSSAFESRIARTTTNSIRGQRGRNRRSRSSSAQRPGADREGCELRVRDLRDRVPQLLGVGAAAAFDAEERVRLVDHDPEREAEHEAGHHRLGQEGRDPAHPQRAEHEVDDAGDQRERRRVLHGLVRAEGGGADDRRHDRGRDGAHRRARALDELVRAAEQRVGRQRRERRVEAVLDGDAGQRRVGEALRHDERPDRDARDRVGDERAP